MPAGLLRSYSIQNDRRFAAAIQSAAKEVSDLRVAFGLIAADWMKSNVAQFSLKGSGQYPPLSQKYQERKNRLGGAGVPILVGLKRNGGVSGTLRDSISGTPNDDTIIEIGKHAMILGTRVEHGIYHQSDLPRRKMPLRKFLFIGPEAPRSAPSEITGRLERWLSILQAETQRKLKGVP